MTSLRSRIFWSTLGVVPILFALGVAVFALMHHAPKENRAYPLGLTALPWPSNNPYNRRKVELGRLLYFDRRLSADATVSCATCHEPRFGFADPKPVSIGVRGGHGTRNSPTVLNAAYNVYQFWDGRASSLEEQSLGPMVNPVEMGNTHVGIVRTLQGIPGYRKLFGEAFGSDEISIERVAMAIASFERTVLSGNSAYDRYKDGDVNAMTPQQFRGLDVFVKKGQCAQCHKDPFFTDHLFHNIGVGMDKPHPDEGRYVVTRQEADWGAFKTPSLRDVARTAPYMHDGSMRTLEEVVDFYDRGGTPNRHLDLKISPLKLTVEEKKDLIAFLKALSGDGWQSITAPATFPQ